MMQTDGWKICLKNELNIKDHLIQRNQGKKPTIYFYLNAVNVMQNTKLRLDTKNI